MVFYWSDDQLKTRSLSGLVNGSPLYTTHLTLPLVEEEQLSVALTRSNEGIVQFLLEALFFSRTLEYIEVQENYLQLFVVSRKKGEVGVIERPVWFKDSKSILCCDSINISELNVTAKSFQQKQQHVCTLESLDLVLIEGSVTSEVDDNFQEQVQKVIKKNAPSTTTVALVYQPQNHQILAKKEIEGDQNSSEKIMCKTGGRIFIGFPTHQETGTAFHLFSQVIPTIERENLDFNYPCIKKWNKQLIQIAGRIMRLYFCYEVSRIAKQAENDTISPHPGMDRIINLIKALPFEPTAPSKKVGELLMKGFFDPKFGSQNLSLPTQKGNLARTLR
eukprot:TRINITY_DN426_c0_g1_i7.p1 TRINITY_DN426_c0_g1~~TRINITY_DN426_c0_g1_i7.p1  ORF type:complete len:333 (+),score=75.86 TRINITY_DN426_c0_g1_i7:602-1600(+)